MHTLVAVIKVIVISVWKSYTEKINILHTWHHYPNEYWRFLNVSNIFGTVAFRTAALIIPLSAEYWWVIRNGTFSLSGRLWEVKEVALGRRHLSTHLSLLTLLLGLFHISVVACRTLRFMQLWFSYEIPVIFSWVRMTSYSVLLYFLAMFSENTFLDWNSLQL